MSNKIMTDEETLRLQKLRAETELAERELAISKNGRCVDCELVLELDVRRHKGSNGSRPEFNLPQPVRHCEECGDKEIERIYYAVLAERLREPPPRRDGPAYWQVKSKERH